MNANDLNPQLHVYDMATGVTAFSTTRHGGCSEGAYGTFNINPYCGDGDACVQANRSALCRVLGIEPGCLVLPHQVHGVESRVIGPEYLSLPPSVRQMVLEGVDAVMTSMPGVCVGVSTADCIPLLMYDPVHRAVCAVHAGWRGTVARIAHKAVCDMGLAYGTRPADLQVTVGPGISADAFEVGDEVYDQFREAGFDLSVLAVRKEKWHIDLPACNRAVLVQAGVQPQNIHLSGLCTVRRQADFFSARALGTQSGRIYNGIMLARS